jgi:hypothetical protein
MKRNQWNHVQVVVVGLVAADGSVVDPIAGATKRLAYFSESEGVL